MKDPRPIFDWLVDGAPGAATAADVVQLLGERLLAAGIPLSRLGAFVGTLHPDILGRSFFWKDGNAVVVREIAHAFSRVQAFQKSPVSTVVETKKPYRRRLMDPSAPCEDFAILEELRGEGTTDYLAAPMVFLDGQVHVLTFATRDPGGFAEEHIEALLDLLRPLARVAEIFALKRVAATLLSTYVGRNAGERILAGKIRLGDMESIRAVLWFSDLRGFTELARTVGPDALIAILNDVFGCQVTAIEKQGGEVLKFMGDGLLAIFPLEGREAGAPVASALAAAEDALSRLRVVNEARAAGHEVRLRFGVALHVGDVAYGNIGGGGRLDFTCIGAAVNLASRLEGLTGKLDRPLVVSAEFARAAQRRMVSLGHFELKGVDRPEEAFGPSAGDPLAEW